VPAPGFVRAHADAVGEGRTYSRGAVRCIPSTEWLSDPATGELFTEVDGEPVDWNAEPMRSRRAELARPVVTAEQIAAEPAQLDAISQEGFYPTPGMRAHERAVRELLGAPHPCWFLGVNPHNMAMSARVFHDLGGWDVPELSPQLDFGM